MVVTIRPYARRIDADTIGLYTENLTKLLQLDKATANTITVIGGGSTTGDGLKLRANSIDTYPQINMYGNDGFDLVSSSIGSIYMKQGTQDIFKMRYDTPDSVLSSVSNNKNIFLQPHGTGLVKFGTYSALSGETLSGYITTKDSGGTTRKFAVVS